MQHCWSYSTYCVMKHQMLTGLHYCQKMCYFKYFWKCNAWIAVWYSTFQLLLYFPIFIFNCLDILLQNTFILFLDYFAKLILLKHGRKMLAALLEYEFPLVPETGYSVILSSIHIYIDNFLSLSNSLQPLIYYSPPCVYIAIEILLSSFDRMTWP